MNRREDKLVILDLDETLIHSRMEPLEHSADLEIDPLFVYVRPGAEKLIQACATRFSIAIWSAGSPRYVERIAEHLLKDLATEHKPVFIWDREDCSRKKSALFSFQELFVKDLTKVEQFGFSLESTLIIEDDPVKIEDFKKNAIIVKQFFGEADDRELDMLLDYLDQIERVDDFRELDKNIWCFQDSRDKSRNR